MLQDSRVKFSSAFALNMFSLTFVILLRVPHLTHDKKFLWRTAVKSARGTCGCTGHTAGGSPPFCCEVAPARCTRSSVGDSASQSFGGKGVQRWVGVRNTNGVSGEVGKTLGVLSGCGVSLYLW